MIRTFDGRYGVKRDLSKFVGEYQFEELQFVVGCGFEIRTPAALRCFAERTSAKIHLTVVDLLNRNDPSYRKARRLQMGNMNELERMASKRNCSFKRIKANLYSKTLRAHVPVVESLIRTLRKFSGDFLLDISAMPRSIVFAALRLLWESKRVQNLFVVYTEDKGVGALETQAAEFRSPKFLPNFHHERRFSKFAAWFPILGGDPRPIQMIKSYMRFNDVYPVVGFPSTKPIETDEIVKLNRGIIGDNTEKLIFASMNDPFQLSIKLSTAIDELRSSFGGDIRTIISPHGSKPQSIGAFMTAMTRQTEVLYCQPLSYKSLPGSVGSSNLYWLKGIPYRD